MEDDICQIQTINEKNCLLINYNNIIKIYKINNNQIKSTICSQKLNYNVKMYKINNELILLIKKNYYYYHYYDYDYDYYYDYGLSLSFLKIEYNSKDEPIKMNFQYYKEKCYLTKNLCVIDEKKIISVDAIDNSFSLYKIYDNKFSFQKKINLHLTREIIPSTVSMEFDTINKNVIIYYTDYNNNIYLNFYELNDNFNFKKNIKINNKNKRAYMDMNIFKQINKDNYILYNKDTNNIYIISSKYLECVNIINMKNYGPYGLLSIHVLNNSNQIIISYDKGHISGYEFYNNELQIIDEHKYNFTNIIDIKEINEQGDYLIITKTNKRYHQNNYKFYIFENDDNSLNMHLMKYCDCDKHNDEYEQNLEYQIDFKKLNKQKKKGKYKMKNNYKKNKKSIKKN